MQSFEWVGSQSFVATVALVLSVISFGFTWLLDRRGHARDDRIEKSSAYLGLELASIEVFKYKAEHWDALEWGETGATSTGKPEAQLSEEADAFFYQSLNLFEVASRFRHAGVIEAEIYASWVAWFYETLEFSYFREQWVAEYRDNYTPETRAIFDSGLLLDWESADDDARREAFYAAVGAICKCPIISAWRVPVVQGPEEPEARKPGVDPGELTFAWGWGDCAAEAAAFAARVIGSQQSYISHGEIQTGLSRDGKSWIEGLEQRFASDFAAPAGPREMLVARRIDGAIAGIAVVAWELDGPMRYAVIEDMAVDPGLRGSGVGRELLEKASARIDAAGAKWTFLESGLDNHGAHGFFEKAGFHTVSKVFARQNRAA